MHPYIPYTAIPIAVLVAWFAANTGFHGDRLRYSLQPVQQLDDPSALMAARSEQTAKPDIRVRAFLPHIPPKPASPTPTLVLHSVMTGAKLSLATINGQVVKVGDKVAGYQVKRISADGVELFGEGKTRRIAMRPLHELPPPAPVGSKTPQSDVPSKASKDDLTQDFWKIFDSLNP